MKRNRLEDPAEDAVVERHPADRGEQRRHERSPAVAQSRRPVPPSQGCRHRKRDRDEAKAGQLGIDEAGDVRKEVVEWRSATLAEHGPEHVAERRVADEEDERFVLIGRQRVQAKEQEDPRPAAIAPTPRR